MSDVTVKHLDDMEALGRGMFVTVGRSLGVTSFGINVECWPPNATGHPEHDAASTGQEGATVRCLGAVPGAPFTPSGPAARS